MAVSFQTGGVEMTARCPYCAQLFTRSPFRPQQRICSQPECQLRRHREYHRQKIRADPVYRETCLNSQKQWQATHPDYPKQYRQQHPESVEKNRQRQRRRDQGRRVGHLVKNNLALDLKHSASEVWLMGPEMIDLVKNNLAFSKVLIFQTVSGASPSL
jgi:hypothetical protein